MPPKRRRRFQGLYYHSSPPKVMPMNGQFSNENSRRRRDGDDFSVKLSTIRIWMHEKDIGKLTRILWAGQGNRLSQQASTNPKVKRFLAAVPYVMNAVKEVHQAVIDNTLEVLQTKLEPPVPPALITSKDANGLNVIHKSAGLGHYKILEYLIGIWPEGVHETDITGKTPLHWAASAKNNMRCYTLLTQNGCDEEALDYKMKTPSFYRHKPHEIERAFLTYVPEAPRVSPDIATDWEALSDESGDGKKPEIRIPDANGFSMRVSDTSAETTSEAEGVSANGDEEISKDDEAPAPAPAPAPIENGNHDNDDHNNDNDDDDDAKLVDNEINADEENQDAENENNTNALNDTTTTTAAATLDSEAKHDANDSESNDAEKHEDGDQENTGNEEENKDEGETEKNNQQGEDNEIAEKESDDHADEETKELETESSVDANEMNDDEKDDDALENHIQDNNNNNDNDGNDEIERESTSDESKEDTDLNNGNDGEDEIKKENGTEKTDNEERRDIEQNAMNEGNDFTAQNGEINEEENKVVDEIVAQVNGLVNDADNNENGKNSDVDHENDNENTDESEKAEHTDEEKYDSEEKEHSFSENETVNGQVQKIIQQDRETGEKTCIKQNGNDNVTEEEEEEKAEDEQEKDKPDNYLIDKNEKNLNLKENGIITNGRGRSGGGGGTDSRVSSSRANSSKLKNLKNRAANEKNQEQDEDEDDEEESDDNDEGDDSQADGNDDVEYETTDGQLNGAESNNQAVGSGGSITSSLAIEGYVEGASEDNTVQSQSAAYVDKESNIQQIIATGNMEQLAQIVLNGDGNKLLNMQSTEPEIQAFLNNVPNYMNKIRRVHEAARTGSLLSLQQALDRRKFAIAKDEISPNSASPLHVAVLFGNGDIVRYLAARFPETTTIMDNDGRTALHYAATIKDNGHFYNVLTQLGANPKTMDKLGHPAEFYLNNEESHNILSYRQLLSNFGAEELEDELLSDQGQAENQNFESNPIFKTEQGQYLATNLADPLIKALTEIANKRPEDPVAFLTGFLQNYIHTRNPNGTVPTNTSVTQTNTNSSSSNTNSTAVMNTNSTSSMRNAHVQNADDIEEDRMSTVDGDTPTPGDDRDEHGQSMLHFACARSHRRGGLIHLIEESNIDITYRDELYRTARDVSLQANQQSNAKEIDRYVLSLAVVGNIRPFEYFALAGYDHIIDVTDDDGKSIIDIAAEREHEDLADFLRNLRSLEEAREELHQMIRENNMERVKSILKSSNAKWLLKAKNYYGRTALHIAILKEATEMVEYFVEISPEALKIGDNLERNALHYAMGTNAIESLSHILIQKGAKRTSKDLKGRQPSYYFMNKADILRLQEEEEENR